MLLGALSAGTNGTKHASRDLIKLNNFIVRKGKVLEAISIDRDFVNKEVTDFINNTTIHSKALELIVRSSLFDGSSKFH